MLQKTYLFTGIYRIFFRGGGGVGGSGTRKDLQFQISTEVGGGGGGTLKIFGRGCAAIGILVQCSIYTNQRFAKKIT